MKKLILAILIIFVSLAIAIPATSLGIAEIEKARVEQIEAETRKMRVQIDADNAQHARAKDWYHTVGNTVMIALLIVAFMQKSRRQDERIVAQGNQHTEDIKEISHWARKYIDIAFDKIAEVKRGR